MFAKCCAFSALTLLFGRQEEHLARKKIECWGTSITGISKANVQHLFSFVPKLTLSVINKIY